MGGAHCLELVLTLLGGQEQGKRRGKKSCRGLSVVTQRSSRGGARGVGWGGGVSDRIRNNAAPILSRDEKKNEQSVSG